MTQTIWKYSLDRVIKRIDIPKDAEFLTLQLQRNTPCLWVLVNPDAELETWEFEIYGTGQPIDSEDLSYYVGTYQISNRDLIFHVFGHRIK
jgi:hypothetical protein